MMISHDTDLLDAIVNKVYHLDANRAEMDIYAMSWKLYLKQRETDEKRRRRERANAERKAAQLFAQADKLGAKATKAAAAHNMARRAAVRQRGSPCLVAMMKPATMRKTITIALKMIALRIADCGVASPMTLSTPSPG